MSEHCGRCGFALLPAADKTSNFKYIFNDPAVKLCHHLRTPDDITETHAQVVAGDPVHAHTLVATCVICEDDADRLSPLPAA